MVRMLKKSLLLVINLTLIGCATPEYKNAQGECRDEAYQKYPIYNVPKIVTLTRPVQVPTGQTDCVTTHTGNVANTTCNPVTRTEYVPYQQNMIVDENAHFRNQAVRSCTAQLCNSRFGNVECKTK